MLYELPVLPVDFMSAAWSMKISCQSKKLLTSKIRYVSIRGMHARNVNVSKASHRESGGWTARRLNVDKHGLSLLILLSLIVLLIIGRGAGTG